jgi:hypothetical protein
LSAYPKGACRGHEINFHCMRGLYSAWDVCPVDERPTRCTRGPVQWMRGLPSAWEVCLMHERTTQCMRVQPSAWEAFSVLSVGKSYWMEERST